MDINNIFNNFGKEEKEEVDETTLLSVDFSTHPLYWIGGFHKIVNSYVLFTNYINKTFKPHPNEINPEDLEKVNNSILYNKAWDFIKKINLNNKFHIDCIKLKSNESLLKSLELAKIYFEGEEEYEKCAFLKGIQDKVKDFLI